MLREWKFNLSIKLDRASQTPVYLQVAHAIIGEIQRGRFTPGSVLPSTRSLSELLGINRKTAISVYDELIAQGWLTSAIAKGTFVSSKLSVSPNKPFERQSEHKSYKEGTQFANIRAGGSTPLVFPKPGMLFLDDGVPDTRLFPAAVFARAYSSAIKFGGRQSKLGYGDPRGSEKLRRAISRILGR